MIVRGRSYEHTLAYGGTGLAYEPGEPAQIARQVMSGEAFDAAEFPLSAAMIMADRDALTCVPIPVFPARSFVHGYLFVRRESPLRNFADLAGRHIGLRDFCSTGAIWFRGLLADRGLDWRTIRWTTGPKPRFAPPPDAEVAAAEGDLEQMLLDGAIDVFFSARVREARRPAGERRVRALLVNPDAWGAEYFRDSGIYPIIHTVVLSRRTLAERPDAARLVYDHYVAAKAQALRLDSETCLLPWTQGLREAAAAQFGEDPLPYGLGPANRHALATMARYLAEQKLIASRRDVETLFHPDSASWPPG